MPHSASVVSREASYNKMYRASYKLEQLLAPPHSPPASPAICAVLSHILTHTHTPPANPWPHIQISIVTCLQSIDGSLIVSIAADLITNWPAKMHRLCTWRHVRSCRHLHNCKFIKLCVELAFYLSLFQLQISDIINTEKSESHSQILEKTVRYNTVWRESPMFCFILSFCWKQ